MHTSPRVLIQHGEARRVNLWRIVDRFTRRLHDPKPGIAMYKKNCLTRRLYARSKTNMSLRRGCLL
eukprot:768081-Hanusia_phi.AAC.1